MSPDPARQAAAALREGGPPTGVTTTAPPDRRNTSASSIPAVPVSDVLGVLGSSPRGLTSAEAATRRDRCGPNELPGVRRGQVWRRLVAQFTDLFAVVLLVSSAITFLAYWLGQPRDPATLQLALFRAGVLRRTHGRVPAGDGAAHLSRAARRRAARAARAGTGARRCGDP
ncbi:cation-transporting P-type ATPase [Streptomyces sp. NPDC007851]|uniref:cation-transporting P-type ATPase n=1 Tax=Streptomyces sp. NPDC007851 TaxID=3155008 RepID=UPI00340272AA